MSSSLKNQIMKTNLLLIATGLVSLLSINSASAQSLASADQNPNYEVSRAKYMKMADSLTAWHSTTFQETYKAIDYLEDKRIAREERRDFRRQLRLIRARNSGRWFNDGYYNPYNSYRFSPYRNRFNNGFYRHSPRFNSLYWNTLPSILTWGLLCR